MTSTNSPGASSSIVLSNGEIFSYSLRILIVDEDPIALQILGRYLRICQHQVTKCDKVEDARRRLRENKDDYDMVIKDVSMSDEAGFQFIQHVAFDIDIPVVAMSAECWCEIAMSSIQHGAVDCLIKPIKIDDLKNLWQFVFIDKLRGQNEV